MTSRIRQSLGPATFFFMACLAGIHPAEAVEKNGFDLHNSSIPADRIRQGGPPRDGIPAIDDPRFLRSDEASFLGPDDRVLGVFHAGVAKAYPIKILNWHEIVNDYFDDKPVVVSYCPLCNTGMVFKASIKGKRRTFGVSGLLYNSDVLLYDRQTESLWSQILGRAVSGPLRGEELVMLPASHTSWSDWSRRHPETLVLSRETGYRRDYNRSPYLGYEQTRRLYFPVEEKDDRYHSKELVIGVEINGEFKAYPFGELSRRNKERFKDEFAGRDLTVIWSESNRTGRIEDASGNEIPSVIAYWFAWYAFHPDTAVFQARKK